MKKQKDAKVSAVKRVSYFLLMNGGSSTDTQEGTIVFVFITDKDDTKDTACFILAAKKDQNKGYISVVIHSKKK